MAVADVHQKHTLLQPCHVHRSVRKDEVEEERIKPLHLQSETPIDECGLPE